MYTIVRYITPDGQDVYEEWQKGLRDGRAKVAAERRLIRAEMGNLGDHKFCRDGVWELRIDVGAGYRIYYAHSGEAIIVLLCGGDKRSQSADIDRAALYWKKLREELHADKKPRRRDG